MPFAGQAIPALCLRATAADRPNRIGKVLLYERYLGLNRKLDVLKAGFLTAVRCDACQDPGTAFLVHKRPSPVNRIHNNAPYSVSLIRSSRQNEAPLLDPFRYQNQRLARGYLLLEEIYQQILRDPVYGVYSVAFSVVIYAGQVSRRSTDAGLEH